MRVTGPVSRHGSVLHRRRPARGSIRGPTRRMARPRGAIPGRLGPRQSLRRGSMADTEQDGSPPGDAALTAAPPVPTPVPPGLPDVELARMLDLLSDLVARYRVDDLRLTYCNRAWAAQFKADPSELIGTRLDRWLNDEERAGLRAAARPSGTGQPVPARRGAEAGLAQPLPLRRVGRQVPAASRRGGDPRGRPRRHRAPRRPGQAGRERGPVPHLRGGRDRSGLAPDDPSEARAQLRQPVGPRAHRVEGRRPVRAASTGSGRSSTRTAPACSNAHWPARSRPSASTCGCGARTPAGSPWRCRS